MADQGRVATPLPMYCDRHRFYTPLCKACIERGIREPTCAGCKTPLARPEDFYVDPRDGVWDLCHACGPTMTPPARTAASDVPAARDQGLDTAGTRRPECQP